MIDTAGLVNATSSRQRVAYHSPVVALSLQGNLVRDGPTFRAPCSGKGISEGGSHERNPSGSQGPLQGPSHIVTPPMASRPGLRHLPSLAVKGSSALESPGLSLSLFFHWKVLPLRCLSAMRAPLRKSRNTTSVGRRAHQMLSS
jgi:hypothetical protein